MTGRNGRGFSLQLLRTGVKSLGVDVPQSRLPQLRRHVVSGDEAEVFSGAKVVSSVLLYVSLSSLVCKTWRLEYSPDFWGRVFRCQYRKGCLASRHRRQEDCDHLSTCVCEV